MLMGILPKMLSIILLKVKIEHVSFRGVVTSPPGPQEDKIALSLLSLGVLDIHRALG